MNELERMTILVLLESGNVSSAALFKQCEVVKQSRIGMKNIELIIEVPMQQYRSLNSYADEVLLIEACLLKNAKLIGEKVSAIIWTGMRTYLQSAVKTKTISRATIARYNQISEQQLFSGDYGSSVITARKAVKMVCVEIIAQNHPNRDVPRVSLARLWGETKEILLTELRRTVHSDSIPRAILHLDRTITVAAGIHSPDAELRTIKFKTVSADSIYIVNNCFSVAYFLYDIILSNMSAEDSNSYGNGLIMEPI